MHYALDSCIKSIYMLPLTVLSAFMLFQSTAISSFTAFNELFRISFLQCQAKATSGSHLVLLHR